MGNENKMKVIPIEKISDKLSFNNYVESDLYARASLRCPNCKSNVAIKYKNLEKHALSKWTNLLAETEQAINSFVKEEKIEEANSFLDYKCLDCKNPIRIYYESWAGGRHGESGFDLKFGIVEKFELEDWRIEFNEQSNNVWQFRMIHKSGSIIEKVGINLIELLKKTREDAKYMNNQLGK